MCVCVAAVPLAGSQLSGTVYWRVVMSLAVESVIIWTCVNGAAAARIRIGSPVSSTVNQVWPMTEYYEEGGLLYEQSPPMHIKVESPEGPFGGGASENGFPREDEDSEGSCDQNSGLPGGLPFNVVVVHPNIMAPSMSSDDLLSIEQSKPEWD